MLTTGILIPIAAIVFSVLIYFAGVQRGKRYRAEDKDIREKELIEAKNQRLKKERDKRIRDAVDRYRNLVISLSSSNLNGMLKSGVLGLQSSKEVEEEV
jgi:hypothetical protein